MDLKWSYCSKEFHQFLSSKNNCLGWKLCIALMLNGSLHQSEATLVCTVNQNIAVVTLARLGSSLLQRAWSFFRFRLPPVVGYAFHKWWPCGMQTHGVCCLVFILHLTDVGRNMTSLQYALSALSVYIVIVLREQLLHATFSSMRFFSTNIRTALPIFRGLHAVPLHRH